ncbi:MAG: sulfotransferase, partial [Chloroflexota bacterium]|nr:sulfotransferase [Chloroflexota bacterium]
MDTLLGITAGDWWTLLRENRFAVDPSYWRRAGMLTVASLMNSVHRRREERVYGIETANVEIKAPLFIIGHWRTGTTLVHNLFALDDQFAYPNLFQISNPHTFLSREAAVAKRLADAPSRK